MLLRRAGTVTGAGLIIPERVLSRFVGDRAQRVAQSKPEQGLETVAGLRPEQRVIDPSRRVVDVGGSRNDIEIAGQHERLFGLKPLP